MQLILWSDSGQYFFTFGPYRITPYDITFTHCMIVKEYNVLSILFKQFNIYLIRHFWIGRLKYINVQDE